MLDNNLCYEEANFGISELEAHSSFQIMHDSFDSYSFAICVLPVFRTDVGRTPMPDMKMLTFLRMLTLENVDKTPSKLDQA